MSKGWIVLVPKRPAPNRRGTQWSQRRTILPPDGVSTDSAAPDNLSAESAELSHLHLLLGISLDLIIFQIQYTRFKNRKKYIDKKLSKSVFWSFI